MGILIAIEGIDGAGKGTQTGRLVDALQQRGLQVGQMRFPRYAATTFGTAIGDFLNGRFGTLHDVHPQLAAVLYAGDRFESKTELLRLMQNSDVVVLDRFVGSNLAHQAAKLDGDDQSQLITWIEDVEFRVFGMPRADLTILIDLPAHRSREMVGRKEKRDYTDQDADLHESDESYLGRVQECYRRIAASRGDWTTITAVDDSGQLRSIDDIHASIMQPVSELLNHRR